MILKGFLGVGTILVKTGSGEMVIVEEGTRHKYSISNSVSVKRCHGTLIQEGPQTMRMCSEQGDQDGERP